MRVAYVGNFTRSWCTEVHVAESLRSLGHTVVPLQENHLNWRALPQLVKARRVGLVLWTRTWAVDNDAALAALDKLRRQGIPTVSFHLDRWLGLDREYQLDVEAFFRTDVVVTPDATAPERWSDRGIRHEWMPPGVLAAECRPVLADRERFPHDVVFVGTNPYPHRAWQRPRARLLHAMRLAFGRRFAVYPLDRTKPVRGRSLGQLYASAKVVVGDSCLVPPVVGYWSDRVPETLGRGGVLVHPWVERLDEWYPLLPTFPVGNTDAAVQLVRRLLADDIDRDSLRATNRAQVLARDTYSHRMSAVLELAKATACT